VSRHEGSRGSGFAKTAESKVARARWSHDATRCVGGGRYAGIARPQTGEGCLSVTIFERQPRRGGGARASSTAARCSTTASTCCSAPRARWPASRSRRLGARAAPLSADAHHSAALFPHRAKAASPFTWRRHCCSRAPFARRSLVGAAFALGCGRRGFRVAGEHGCDLLQSQRHSAALRHACGSRFASPPSTRPSMKRIYSGFRERAARCALPVRDGFRLLVPTVTSRPCFPTPLSHGSATRRGIAAPCASLVGDPGEGGWLDAAKRAA